MGIIISTGDINRSYDIVDVVFAMDTYSQGMFSSTDPNKVFQGVIKQLDNKCKSIDADAVINCHFEYRDAPTGGLMTKKPELEIFAYGTAIRFR